MTPNTALLIRATLMATMGLSALACSTPTPRPDAEPTPDAVESPTEDAPDTPAPPAQPDPPAQPELNSGHDMKQSTREEIHEVPMDRRPAGVDCDRCAHVMIGTQGGTKHRCLKANPELATNPDADKRVSCEDSCCPDME